MIEDFILQIDDFIDKPHCNHVIEMFENAAKMGLTFSRKTTSNDHHHEKADMQFFSGDAIEHEEILIDHWPLYNGLMDLFWNNVYKLYSEKYSTLYTLSPQTIRTIKIQKTNVGEGYHKWHCENDNPQNGRRVLAFILYLNTVREGGETEFLYYPKRIKAKQGRIILWPSGFTHTHRGNPPISNTKYIMTGWTEFA